MKRYIGHFICSAEKRVADFIKNQVKDPAKRDFGSIKGQIIEVKPTIYVLAAAAAVYLNKDSIYYQDPKLLKAMNHALDFIGANQREDGSFDYPTCNFKSAPDTAFCFKRLLLAYRLLLKYDSKDGTKELKDKYYFILCRALNGICKGGFHTPNHRWAICAALMQGANLLDGEPVADEYLDRMGEYLAEGIDGDGDGEYAERSTGNYNAVVNSAMIAMFEESGDEKYLGFVERNLHMMLTYIDPDDTIFTQNSLRQDQGRTDYADQYFYQYLFLTARKYNPEFDAAAHKIIKDNMERVSEAPDCLHILMLHSGMMNYNFQGYGFLGTYRKFYRNSGVMRVKTPKFGYTLRKDKSAFLFMKVQDTPIYIKIGESYCATRNFVPQTLEVKDREYVMTSVEKGWYYLPFKNYAGTNDWWKMDHSRREILENSEIRMTVTIHEEEDGLELTVKAGGLDLLPLRLEICIPAGSILDNRHFYLRAEKDSGMILRDGYLNIIHNQNHIRIGPGYGTHEFQGHYSGEEFNDMGYTIYLNEYTPYEKSVTIKVLD